MEIDDELGRQLHDRATRGQVLSAEEQEQLQAWYDKWDRIEAAMLARNAPPLFDNDELRERIEGELTLIAELTERIRQKERENEVLRQEIAVLSQRLAERAKLRKAS